MNTRNTRSVAPVVGISLILAITLILALATTTFVLGLTEESPESTPLATTELDRTVEPDGDTILTLTHTGGDNVPVSDLELITTSQCFDTATFQQDTKTGSLVNLPASGGSLSSNNIDGAQIFQEGGVKGPIVTDGAVLTAGDQLHFTIESDTCELPEGTNVDLRVRHIPSNTLLASHQSGVGSTPDPLTTALNPSSGGAVSTHTLVISASSINAWDGGNSGDQVNTITVDYPNGASMDGLNQTDITVTMTRTLSDGVDRSTISVNGDSYSGSTATFDLSGSSQTDVAGPVEVEIDGIENPPKGKYTVDITLKGDGNTETVQKEVTITSS